MDEEELGESIRSLVNHFVPVLKDAASVEQAEEILRNAEETDENFHKLDLVTLLNNKIENELSMVLDKEIERQKLNDRPVHVQMQLQDRVVSNILKSSIYADLRQEVLGHTRQAVARLCEEYVDEEQEMMKDVSRNAGGGGGTTLGAATSWTGLMSSKRGGGTQYSFSEDSSVGGSSYNPAGFGFIGLDRFQQIVSGLDSNNPTDIRRSAMTNLCRINPADILDEVQNPLKSVILDALLDPDKVLCWKALEMTAKLLSNSCVSLTKSVYVSFIDHVTTQFTGRRSQMLPLMRDGFSLDDSPVAKELLVKFRLMRDFHLHVSKYWIRYPSESLMENVISTTISLFSVKMNATVTGTSGSSDNDVTVFGASSSNCVTPLHCMSLLDPTALWIKNWLHGAFSRVHLLTELTKNPYIVECAANFCMSYYSTRCKNPEADPLIDADKNACLTPRDTSSTPPYSANQIQFVYFVHSVNLITHVLRFKKGRSIFPVVNKVDKGKIPIPNLLLSLLQFVINPLPVTAKSAKKTCQNHLSPLKVNYNPVEIVKKVFKTLCAEELPCKSCICHNAIIEALMEPVVSWMEYSHGNTTSPTLPSKQTMVNTAEILTYIVSSKVGRKFMTSIKIKTPVFSEVSPPPQPSTDTKKKTTLSSQLKLVELNPCVIVRNFTVRALRAEIGSAGAFESIITQPITEAYIFLCRQLYNQHDEFRLIECEDLASGLSQAWHQCMRSIDLERTPTPGENQGKDRSNVQGSNSQGLKFGDSVSLGGFGGQANMDANNEELKWQNALLDNLLNLAATPKGVSLLLQSGALHSCVNYMFGRYSKKFQVSRCEKFGYGVLVSRISSCAAGMKALTEAGFLELFVSEIWSNIECCPDDRRIAAPYVYPTDPVDSLCMKSFNSLMNVLSSFPAVFELFHGAQLNPKTSYSQRDEPSDVLNLFNRLVMVDNDEKMQSLFNEDQSHTFGLRLVNSVCSSLDSMLLLQTQYNLQKVFLNLQAKSVLNSPPNANAIIYLLDMPLVERNHLLVRISILGGPDERVLPSRELSKACTSYKYKFFHELPIPSSYQVPLKTLKPSTNEMSKFLQNSKNWQLDQKWTSGCSKALIATLQSKQVVRGAQIVEVLERAVEAKLAIGENLLPDAKRESPNVAAISNDPKFLNDIETFGANMLANYGKYLKVIPESKDSETHLQNTIKKSRQILRLKVTKVSNEVRGRAGEVKFSSCSDYPSFDWFSGIIHLMFMGDTKKSTLFLENYAKVCEAVCVWPACGYMFCKNTSGVAIGGDLLEPLMLLVANNVELVVERELPEIASAFRMSGYSPGLIAQHWLRQCFLNFLNWPEIVNYVLVCVVCGVDYQIYSCVAVLKHMYRKILFNSQQQTLLVFLKDEPVVGFRFSDHINYMNDLRKKYQSEFLSDLRKTFLLDCTSV